MKQHRISMSPAIFINAHYEPLDALPQADPRVREFHQSLPHYSPTPLISLPEIAKELGIGHVLLKNESSRLGLPAFKILGASWATARAVTKRLGLSENDKQSLESLDMAAKHAGLTLYAATDGNHGRAVARMAKYLGIEARIFVPRMVDEETKGNIRSEGAIVEVIDGDYDKTVRETSLAAEKHPDGKGVLITDTALEFGDQTAQWIVEGYQTMFDEIEEQVGVKDLTHKNRSKATRVQSNHEEMRNGPKDPVCIRHARSLASASCACSTALATSIGVASGSSRISSPLAGSTAGRVLTDPSRRRH